MDQFGEVSQIYTFESFTVSFFRLGQKNPDNFPVCNKPTQIFFFH